MEEDEDLYKLKLYEDAETQKKNESEEKYKIEEEQQ